MSEKEYFGSFKKKHSPAATGNQSKEIANRNGGGGAELKMNNWMCDIFPLYKYFLLLCVTLTSPISDWRSRLCRFYSVKRTRSYLWPRAQLPTRHRPATNAEVIRLNEAKK